MSLLAHPGGDSFENARRLAPRLWDPHYCLLRGLANSMRRFADTHARPGMTIVDFGCGTKPYRPLFPPDCRYVGVDIEANGHADIVIVPSEPVPLPDGSIDLVISTQVIYKIPDYAGYLMECRRLLRPDGRIMITTHGTWTYHPASGGDYYRFTQDGLRHVLARAGFQVDSMEPVVGTLGTGLHLRQLMFNSWLRRLRLSAVAGPLNVVTNLRILLEDSICPIGTRMSAPVIFTCVAQAK